MAELSGSRPEDFNDRVNHRNPHVDDSETRTQEIGNVKKGVEEESEYTSTLDELLDQYGIIVEQLGGKPNFFKRQQLQKQKEILRTRIGQDNQVYLKIDHELDDAIQREAVLRKEESIEIDAHFNWDIRYGNKEFPENPKTEQAQRFFELYRLMRMINVCMLRNASARGNVPMEKDIPDLDNRYRKLYMKHEELEKEISEMNDYRKNPEQYPLEKWDSLIERAQDLFEEMLLLSRTSESVARQSGFVPYRERSETTGLS